MISLNQAIEEEVSLNSDLVQSRKEVTNAYRSHTSQGKNPIIKSHSGRLSYLATRMPATYAALCFVFSELSKRTSPSSIKSMLDIGSGPGTSLWAGREFFPNLQKATLIERDRQMAELGEKLFSKATFPPHEWLLVDMEKASFAPHDLVICSYSLCELSSEKAKEVCLSAFVATEQYLVIIEPGTPTGYRQILALRKELLKAKVHMVAPCPHYLPCPLGKADWCHFSTRVARTSLHRRAKESVLGYEDEKFSYLIVSKFPHPLPEARILRQPQKRSGHVRLSLCTQKGLEERVISKKNKDLYKKAKDLGWGNSLEKE